MWIKYIRKGLRMEQANSIERYLNLLERYDIYENIYFRGQLEKYKTTPPSIARDTGYLENEAKIFHEAISMRPHDFDNLVLPIEKLSKMQHYGIPTRLVDVTIDPLTALFFAVEDSEDKNAGNVYVYLPNTYEWDSPEAKAVSLLSQISVHDMKINDLCKLYTCEFDDEIESDVLQKLIEKPVFISYCERLRKTNERLYKQKGTFVLCSNKVEEKTVLPEIISIDAIPPVMVIRIPYEYKGVIKDELDTKYNINHATIYPELPSVANYLKQKYKKSNLSLDNSYSVIENKEINTPFIKRLSIVIALTSSLTIEAIKQMCISILREYKDKYGVVWLYVAKNGDDYIMSNWIIRFQWISPSLETRHRPLSLKYAVENGFFYEGNDSYSVLADYYADNIFEDDKELIIKHKNNLDSVISIIKQIIEVHSQNNLQELKKIIHNSKRIVSRGFLINGDFGRSRNVDLDGYLERYSSLFGWLDNLHLWCENKGLNDRQLNYQLNICIKEIKKELLDIQEGHLFWQRKIGILPEDYKEETSHKQKKIFQYTQTLPIKEDTLEISFSVKVHINDNRTFIVSGDTNLFDEAELMLSIKDFKNRTRAQDKAKVKDGQFKFQQISDKGRGYKNGTYIGEISLSIPSVQPKKFIEKAGVQYENITGRYVDRTGIGPIIKYFFEFYI